MFKKILSTFMAFTMVFAFTVPSSAATTSSSSDTQTQSVEDTKAIHFSADNISEKDKVFLNKVTKIFDGYVTNKAGVITFTYSDKQLSDTGFTQAQIVKLHEINSKVCGVSLSDAASDSGSNITPQIFVEGSIIYFEYVDVQAFLFAAASVGPEALYAALVALGSVSLGPVGTAIAAIVGAIGAPSLVSFCYYVIQAVANNEGVYIGIEMNGIFPNIVTGTW